MSSATLDLQQADLRQLLGGSRIGRLGQLLREMLWLPSDLPSFLLFLGVISLLTAGLMLHLQLSVSILETQLLLDSKQDRQAEIERQSAEIVWQIGQAMSLDRVRHRASELGYVVPAQRYYVDAPSAENIAEASTGTMQDGNELSVQSAVNVLEPVVVDGAGEGPFFGPRAFGATLQSRWRDVSGRLISWWQGT